MGQTVMNEDPSTKKPLPPVKKVRAPKNVRQTQEILKEPPVGTGKAAMMC